MTEQEKFNAEVQLRLTRQDTKFEIFMKAQDERFNTFMNELQQQREDIRRLNEWHDADRKSLEAKIDSLGKQINDTWRQTMLGVGGMIIAVGALLFASLK